jgi:phospholipid-binding lipoprotein MlaA
MGNPRFLPLLAATLMLGACATGQNPKDPLEPLNRATTRANTYLDDYLMKPLAIGYEWALPGVVRMGLSNFYGNLSEIRY